MPHWEMSWRFAAVLAAAFAAAGLVLRLPALRRVRRLPPAGAVATESALVVALFALWQLAGSLAVMGTTGALARAWDIWHAERLLHLPSEVALQRLVLPYRLLLEVANGYYIYGHFMPLIAFLAWTFLRHRGSYPQVRAAVVIVTGASLLIQLVPVAPPRMLPQAGFVDTGLLFHQSVYGPATGGLADQYSAMPSVHIAWATLIAVWVWRLAPGRWRWLGIAHAGLMTLVVVVTANHFWADCLVAAALVAVALALVAGARRAWWSVRLRGAVAGAASSELPDPVAAVDGR